MLRQIIIPQYIRRFKVSNSVRALYWEWNGEDIRARRSANKVGKPLLKRFIDKFKHAEAPDDRVHPIHLNERYILWAVSGKKGMPITKIPNRYFTLVELRHLLVQKGYFTFKQSKKMKFLLYDTEEGQIVLANANQAGQAKYNPINGQDLYSGNVQSFVRGTLMQQIKESFLPYIKDIEPVREYPIRVTLTVNDTVRNALGNAKNDFGVGWDIGNRAYPYMKAMLDILVTGHTGENDKNGNKKKFFESKLLEDNRLYITAETVEFCPLIGHDDSERRLTFTIEKETTYSVVINPLYQKYHNERDSKHY